MKNIITFVFLLFCFSLSAQTLRYASRLGSGSQNGTSEANAWTITQAFANATAGMDVYVEADNYGALQLVTSNSGSAGNPIRFIGYTNAPGDIEATAGPTYDVNDWVADSQTLPTNLMPLLLSTDLTPADTDEGIQINHNFVELHNFFVQGYWEGIVVGADDVKLINVSSYRAGAWDPASNCWELPDAGGCDNRYGYGIRVLSNSDRWELRHCNVVDAGIDAYFLRGGSDWVVDQCEAHTYSKGNGTDYLFNFNGAVTSGEFSNSYAKRWYVGGHESRSIVVKCSATGNLFRDFVGERGRMQVFYADNNVFQDFYFKGDGTTNTAEVQLFGDADNNIFLNFEIEDGTGISFLGYNGTAVGTECGLPDDPDLDSGSNNYFINLLVHDVHHLSGMAAVSFHRLGWGPTGNAGENYVINGTFHDVPYLINANRSGIIHFYNTSFSNIYLGEDTFYPGWTDATGSYTATYDYSNFDDITGFTKPAGTSNTEHPAGYTTPGSDYSLQPSSALIDIGTDASVLKAEATTDFDGNARGIGSGDDVGAYEFQGGGTIDVTGVTTFPAGLNIEVGETMDIDETVSPSNADDLTGAWSSSNESVATVDTSGTVTGVGTGTCTITFTTTDGSFTDTTATTVITAVGDDSIEDVSPDIYLTPTNISPEVTADGNAIASWNDKSGNNLHATQANGMVLNVSATRQVEHDGDSYFFLPDDSSLDYTPGTDSFSFVCREGDVVTSNNGYMFSKATVGTRQYGVAYLSGEFQGIYVGGTLSTFSNIPSGPNRLLVAVITPTTVNVWIDGTQVVIDGAVGTALSSSQAVNIGGRTNGGYLVAAGAQFDMYASIPSALTTMQREAIQTEFQVNVTSNEIPVITLLGESPVNITTADTYVDAGATATDAEDGDLTGSIVVAGDTVDDDTPGTYVITYNVEDSDSNAATEVTRTVNVSAVNTATIPTGGPYDAPYFTLNGSNIFYPTN